MLREAFSCGVKRVMLATGRTDLRLGINGLAALVRLKYGSDPLEDGTLFLFCGRRKDRIKGILYEGSGWLMVYMRLSPGNAFQWPRDADEARYIDREQYERLMDGFSVTGTIRKIPVKH